MQYKFTQSDVIKQYLKKLYKKPLLTKIEEKELVLTIEAEQNTILRHLVSYSFFRQELLDLLVNQATDNLFKFCRKVEQDSPENEIEDAKKELTALIGYLSAGDIENSEKFLSSFGISGNLLNNLINNIKKKYDSLNDLKNEIVKLKRWFEVKTDEELVELVTKLKTDKMLCTLVASRFATSTSKLLGKCYEVETAFTNLAEAMSKIDNEVFKVFNDIQKSDQIIESYRNKLIERNLRLVVSRAKKFVNRGLNMEDLIQEGNIGLIKAVNKHDSSRGTRVTTYATWWIDQTIRRAISNKAKTVRVPTHIEVIQNSVNTAISELSQELGRKPTLQEIADRSKVDFNLLQKMQSTANHEVGLEDEINENTRIIDTLRDDHEVSPFEMVASEELRLKVKEVLSTLPPRTEMILRLRFGIGEESVPMTLQEIADQIGITKMGVKIHETKGLEKLKKKKGLEDYVD